MGTRDMTDYGRRVAFTLGYELAREGAVVVAGMARALTPRPTWAVSRQTAKTVAVLGSGLDVPYPPENARLQQVIETGGAVVSEYPPGSLPYASTSRCATDHLRPVPGG